MNLFKIMYHYLRVNRISTEHLKGINFIAHDTVDRPVSFIVLSMFLRPTEHSQLGLTVSVLGCKSRGRAFESGRRAVHVAYIIDEVFHHQVSRQHFDLF